MKTQALIISNSMYAFAMILEKGHGNINLKKYFLKRMTLKLLLKKKVKLKLKS